MEIRERIERELQELQQRLRLSRGVAELEDTVPVVADSSSTADLLDGVTSATDREMSFATRSRLVERRNRLAVALERILGGTHGLCEECQEPIPPARLQAIPEATTCVPCQSRRERRMAREDDTDGVTDDAVLF
jgi:DnaK suppressor protein